MTETTLGSVSAQRRAAATLEQNNSAAPATSGQLAGRRITTRTRIDATTPRAPTPYPKRKNIPLRQRASSITTKTAGARTPASTNTGDPVPHDTLRRMLRELPQNLRNATGVQLPTELDGKEIEHLLRRHNPALRNMPKTSPEQTKERHEFLAKAWKEMAAQNPQQWQHDNEVGHQAYGERVRAKAQEQRKQAASKILNAPSVKDMIGKIANAESVQQIRVQIDGLRADTSEIQHSHGSMMRLADYTERLESDISRMHELAGKMENGKIKDKERNELNTLLRSHQQSLAQAQTWIGERLEGMIEENPQSFIAEMTVLSGLSQRLAERHMELADITASCIDNLPDEEPVTRADRLYHASIDARGVLNGLQLGQAQLRPLNPPAYDDLVLQLEQHAGQLERAYETDPDADRISALIDAPIHTDTSRTESAKQTLQERWRMKQEGGGDSAWYQRRDNIAWLPLSQPGISQREMLEDFVRFRLGDKSVDLTALSKRGRTQAVNNKDWGEIQRQVGEQSGEASYTSTITPAGNTAHKHFQQPYTNAGVNCHDRLQGAHVCNLAQTQLTTNDGRVLFNGLRHGVLDPYEVNPKNLRSLTNVEAQQLISQTVWPEMRTSENETLEDAATRMQNMGDKELSKLAQNIRDRGAENMAQELATAALVAKPELLQQALNGEEVELPMSSISLLTPDYVFRGAKNEQDMLARQTKALRSLENNGEAVTLKVRNKDGNLQDVRVRVRMRNFNFGVNAGAIGKLHGIPMDKPGLNRLAGWGFAARINDPALEKLLGSSREPYPSIGSDVDTYIIEQSKRLQEIENLIKNVEETDVGRIVTETPEHLDGLENLLENIQNSDEAQELQQQQARLEQVEREFNGLQNSPAVRALPEDRARLAKLEKHREQLNERIDYPPDGGISPAIPKKLAEVEENIATLRSDIRGIENLLENEGVRLEEEVNQLRSLVAVMKENIDKQAAPLRREVGRLQNTQERLAGLYAQKQAIEQHQTLVAETAGQIKNIWRSESFRSVGAPEPYKMVSRLAFLTHLMGESVAFNCKSGKDRTGQLDAEVKQLAADAHETGTIQQPDRPVNDDIKRRKTDFALNTGNLEMQRLNTGLPGYKLKKVPPLAAQLQSQAWGRYRGGSDFVNN